MAVTAVAGKDRRKIVKKTVVPDLIRARWPSRA